MVAILSIERVDMLFVVLGQPGLATWRQNRSARRTAAEQLERDLIYVSFGLAQMRRVGATVFGWCIERAGVSCMVLVRTATAFGPGLGPHGCLKWRKTLETDPIWG